MQYSGPAAIQGFLSAYMMGMQMNEQRRARQDEMAYKRERARVEDMHNTRLLDLREREPGERQSALFAKAQKTAQETDRKKVLADVSKIVSGMASEGASIDAIMAQVNNIAPDLSLGETEDARRSVVAAIAARQDGTGKPLPRPDLIQTKYNITQEEFDDARATESAANTRAEELNSIREDTAAIQRKRDSQFLPFGMTSEIKPNLFAPTNTQFTEQEGFINGLYELAKAGDPGAESDLKVAIETYRHTAGAKKEELDYLNSMLPNNQEIPPPKGFWQRLGSFVYPMAVKRVVRDIANERSPAIKEYKLEMERYQRENFLNDPSDINPDSWLNRKRR